ncbi:hypothetical protein F2Q68_00008890 [Brassica cretica]|uniref:Uncharacterized protein n=1 Tax=Brassica cretica TaxID=69181 RepID=A0A8S9L429_BRACR|nr:hypothetical protein F2Q68_00008890 [Brassica cretica]
MADQEAGWEATRKQNEQMMEMMKRMYPNEQFPYVFLGIFRRRLPRNIPRDICLRNIPTDTLPSEYPDGYTSSAVGIFRYLFSLGMFPRTVPSERTEETPTNSPRKCFFGMSSESLILGIPSELSEEIPRKFYFPTRNFRRPFSSVCPRNTVIPRTYRRYLFSESRCFLVVV